MNILARIAPEQWKGMITALILILFGDVLYNICCRLLGKSRFIHVPLRQKLTLIYVAFVLLVTLFIREIGSGGCLAWMPLWSWQEVLLGHNFQLLWQILLNILLFVPLGGLLALNRGRSAKATVLTGFGLSLCIELCQLVFRLGLFEWDDILHNGAGCALGMIAVRSWKGFLQKVKN